jgi:hypothetical protein
MSERSVDFQIRARRNVQVIDIQLRMAPRIDIAREHECALCLMF